MHLRTWRSRNWDTAWCSKAHSQRPGACSHAQQSYPASQSVGDPTTSQQISHNGEPQGPKRGKPLLACEISDKSQGTERGKPPLVCEVSDEPPLACRAGQKPLAC